MCRAVLITLGAMAALAGCARVQVEPIEVKPIHITMDVNIRVDRQLDQFFAFEDKFAPPATAPATTQAARTADAGRGVTP